MSSSRGSSRPREWTRVSCIGRRIVYHWATWEAQEALRMHIFKVWGYRRTKENSTWERICLMWLKEEQCWGGFSWRSNLLWEVNHRLSGAGENPPGLFVFREEEEEGRRVWTCMEKGTGKVSVLSPKEEQQLLDLAASPLRQVWLNNKEETDFGKAWRIHFIMSWSCPIFWYAFSKKTCYFRILIRDVSSLS